MRRKMLEKSQYSHIGADFCLRKARDALFWLGMAKAVHDYISKCAICNEFQPQQQKEPLIPHDTPKPPWEDVAVDLFTFDSDKYVVAVDFSDFFVLEPLQDTTTTSVVEMLKCSFATHGIPVTVRTDNSLQLVSEEFQEFAHEWKFNHVTSSPYYAQSNGKAESAVKIAKSLLLESEKRWKRHLALFIGMAKCSDARIRLVAMSMLNV